METNYEKLSKLTQRQREVLKLVCKRNKYSVIGKQLFIEENTVKSHMGYIYKKLDLKLLPPEQRIQKILELFCPLLNDDLPDHSDDTEEPEPIPDTIKKMVEDDEKALILWEPKPIQKVDPIILIPGPRPRRFSWLLVGMILGALIISVVMFTTGNLFPTIEEPKTIVETVVQIEYVNVTVEVPVEKEVVVTATAGPKQATQTPIIQEVIVVVTATPEPTNTLSPTPTELAITPPETILEVGEWWKADGVWLTVSEVEFSSGGLIRIDVMIWNKTGNDLIFEWTPTGSFSLIDNTDHRYEPDYYYKSGVNTEVIEAGSMVKLYHSNINSNNTAKYEDDNFFNVLVTDLIFTVNDLSRFQFAQWHITVSK